MNPTKQEILRVSRDMFNQQGFTQVSLRMISDNMAISVGNLTYHFPKKDDLVHVHYNALSAQIHEALDLSNGKESIISSFLTSTLHSYQAFYSYRYFMLELLFFLRSYPSIKESYDGIRNMRMTQYQRFIDNMRRAGFMFEETIRGNDKLLFKQLYIHNNFWLLQESVSHSMINEDSIHAGIEEIYGILLPHLTLVGKRQFRSALQTLGIHPR